MNLKEFNKAMKIHANNVINEDTTLKEEATKTSLILPFFQHLGYAVFNSREFMPEATADVASKKGEKVDYAIALNGQPVIIVEAKQLNTILSDKHIAQLFRYFSTSSVKIAILTNGDDYWFFTDTQKVNSMDTEPYLKLRMSALSDDDISQLYNYSKEKVLDLDIAENIQLSTFRYTCTEFIKQLKRNNVESDFITYLANKAGIKKADKPKLASILNEVVKQEINTNTKISLPEPEEQVAEVEAEIGVGIGVGIECLLNRKSFGEQVTGRGILHPDMTMTILKGSIVSKQIHPDSTAVNRRKQVESSIQDGIVIGDIKCKSPTVAGGIVIGNGSDGWKDWKTLDGKTIDIYKNKDKTSEEKTDKTSEEKTDKTQITEDIQYQEIPDYIEWLNRIQTILTDNKIELKLHMKINKHFVRVFWVTDDKEKTLLGMNKSGDGKPIVNIEIPGYSGELASKGQRNDIKVKEFLDENNKEEIRVALLARIDKLVK